MDEQAREKPARQPRKKAAPKPQPYDSKTFHLSNAQKKRELKAKRAWARLKRVVIHPAFAFGKAGTIEYLGGYPVSIGRMYRDPVSIVKKPVLVSNDIEATKILDGFITPHHHLDYLPAIIIKEPPEPGVEYQQVSRGPAYAATET